jgi:hypothetical protein
MIKLIATILLLQFSTLIHSQVRLNSNKFEIKSEFSDEKYALKEMNIEGIDAISIVTEIANVLFMFNSEEKCKIAIIVPHTQGDLNYYVELYNNRYVVVSENEWKMYSDNGIAKIDLLFNAEKPAFRWTINLEQK